MSAHLADLLPNAAMPSRGSGSNLWSVERNADDGGHGGVPTCEQHVGTAPGLVRRKLLLDTLSRTTHCVLLLELIKERWISNGRIRLDT
jgi:hypothetical protein